jgi:hypothetical protein
MIGFRPEKMLYRSASSVRIVLECFKKPLQTNDGAAVEIEKSIKLRDGKEHNKMFNGTEKEEITKWDGIQNN